MAGGTKPGRQGGAALFIALLLVLLVSLLGTTSMKRGSMEGQMSAGLYQKQITFQASESAVESTISDVGIMQAARQATTGMVSQDVDVPLDGIEANVTYSFVGNRPAYGWSLDSTGQGASNFMITAVGLIPSTGTSTTTQHGVYRVNPPSGD